MSKNTKDTNTAETVTHILSEEIDVSVDARSQINTITYILPEDRDRNRCELQ